MTIFSTNLEKWARFYPEDAARLAGTECQHVFLIKEKSGEYNLSLEKEGISFELYPSHEPLKETDQWFANLKLNNVNVLYVVGIGLGYVYDAAKTWLHENPEHYLVFVEDNPEVLCRFFETEHAADLLNDKQVRLVDVSPAVKFEKTLNRLSQIYCRYEFLVAGLDVYQREFPESYKKIQSSIAFWHHYQRSVTAEFINYGEHFFNNFYKNLRVLPDAYCGSELSGKFNGVPAIICGAGPSLEKNLKLLETLGDRALIFAGGSSMNAVTADGFFPTFGLGIDPNREQLTRLIMNTAYEVPFFYRSRMFYKALKMVHGDLLYVTGTGGYQISKWLEERFQLYGEPVNEGFNVVNFSISLAKALGCNPIVLVGVDLAYSGHRSYHSGVIPHPLHSRHHDFRTKGLEDLLESKDIYGEPVHTLWKWITESYWISRYAESCPQVLFINSTEGGIGMQGIPNKPLDEVRHYLLQQRFDFNVWLHGEMQETSLEGRVTPESVRQWLSDVLASSMRCLSYCEDLKKETLRLSEVQGQDIEESSDTIKQTREKLEAEPSFTYILEGLERYYGDNTSLESELLIYDQSLSDKERSKRRLQLRSKGYDFLCRALNSNNRLIETELTQETLEKKQGKPEIVPPVEGMVYSFEKKSLVIEDPELGISISEPPAQDLQYIRLEYLSGELKFEQWFSGQEFHGPAIFYAKNGQVLARSWYVHGVQQGKLYQYYLSGTLFSIQQFRNGVKEDQQLYFYRDGVLKTRLHYKAGKLDGDVFLYFPSGQLKRELHFIQGKRNGIERIWNESGLLTIEVEYLQDRPHGVAKCWHDNGVLAQEEHFDPTGKTVSIAYWDEMGLSVPVTTYRQDDFFDAVAKEMEILTKSFEHLCTKLADLLPSLSQGERWKKELEELNHRICDLDALNQELRAASGLDGDPNVEPVWKTVARQRELQEKVQAMTKQLSRDVSGIVLALKQLNRMQTKKS